MSSQKTGVYYTPEIANEILERIAKGEFVGQICQGENMPTKTAFYDWLSKIPGLRERFDKARIERLDTAQDQLTEAIAAAPPNKEELRRIELRMKLDTWMMERLNPTKYGSKTVVRGDKDNPIEIKLSSTLDQRIAARKARTIEHIPSSDSLLPIIDIESAEIE